MCRAGRRLRSDLAGVAAAVELRWDLISNARAGIEAGASVVEPRLGYGLVIHVSQNASTAELANTSVCGRTSPIAAVPSTMMLASRHGTIAAVIEVLVGVGFGPDAGLRLPPDRSMESRLTGTPPMLPLIRDKGQSWLRGACSSP